MLATSISESFKQQIINKHPIPRTQPTLRKISTQIRGAQINPLDNFIMQSTPRLFPSSGLLLRRALSDTTVPTAPPSQNPQLWEQPKETQLLQRMHSNIEPKPTALDAQQLTALESNLDDLFSKLARLNSELGSLCASSTQTSSTAIISSANMSKSKSPQSSPKKKPKRSFQLFELPTVTVPKHLSMQHFQLGNPLGEGKYGEVVQLFHKETGMIFALKKMFKSMVDDYKMHDQVMHEIDCLKKLSHPNIVKLYGGFTDTYHIFLIMEYVHGETLDHMFCSEPALVSKIIFQVLKAIEYMHSNFIVHRDIKPQNLLYSHGVVKVCDFGWAANFKHQQPSDFCGTLDYVSPEVAMKRKYNGSVDLWGVGILAFELITGHVPFKDPNKDKHLSNIINCDQYNILYPKWMETEARDFIGKLLKKDPLLRITVRQALQHPFIKKYQATEVIPSDIGDLIYLK